MVATCTHSCMRPLRRSRRTLRSRKEEWGRVFGVGINFSFCRRADTRTSPKLKFIPTRIPSDPISSGTTVNVRLSGPRTTTSGSGCPITASVNWRVSMSTPVAGSPLNETIRSCGRTPARAAGLPVRHVHHRHGAIRLEPVVALQAGRQRDIVSADTDEAAPDASLAQQCDHHHFGGVDRYREADALHAKDGCRIDADHLAGARDERASGIARIERGVRLDQCSIKRPVRDRRARPTALITPAVTVCWKPNGLPMAIAT